MEKRWRCEKESFIYGSNRLEKKIEEKNVMRVLDTLDDNLSVDINIILLGCVSLSGFKHVL